MRDFSKSVDKHIVNAFAEANIKIDKKIDVGQSETVIVINDASQNMNDLMKTLLDLLQSKSLTMKVSIRWDSIIFNFKEDKE